MRASGLALNRPPSRTCMLIPILSIACVVLAILLLALFYAYQTQRSVLVSVWHLISNLAQRQYARRTHAKISGPAGELARAANSLAEELEGRAARAQQNEDHLVSLLAVLDHTNEMAIAAD